MFFWLLFGIFIGAFAALAYVFWRIKDMWR